MNRNAINIKPIVSVVMITYKHETYLANAIDGILSQKIDFPIELIIADDCSPDLSHEIVNKFIKNHENGVWIKYHKHAKNIGMSQNFIWALNQAEGDYIALCEGDDVWTDPHKLEKQIAFLEKNEKYGLICGGFTTINHLNGKQNNILKEIEDESESSAIGFNIDIVRFWNNWCIQTLTVVFRRKLLNVSDLVKYKNVIDVHVFYQIVKQQNGFYLKEILGIQNITNEGVYSNKSNLEKRKMLYHARKEISKQHKDDKILKSMLFSVASELFVNKQFLKTNKDLSRITLFYDMFISIQSLKDLKHLIKCLINSKDISKMFLSNE